MSNIIFWSAMGEEWWKKYELKIDWLSMNVNCRLFKMFNDTPGIFSGHPKPISEFKRMKEEYERLAIEQFNEDGGLPAGDEWGIFSRSLLKDYKRHLVKRGDK